MYHPYLRGKQNELILLRENAKLLSDAGMIPIIEPVKKNLAPLEKAIENLAKENVPFILIVNPRNGDFKNDSLILFRDLIDTTLKNYEDFCLGYIVDSKSTLLDIKSFLDDNTNKSIAFIHNGYPKANELASITKSFDNVKKHIFIDEKSKNGKLYQSKFIKDGVSQILIRDGFNKMKNSDYPDYEPFSELHLTYKLEGMNGFGDFLIVGDDYSENGGPAYAVALHLTYIGDEELMDIKHFKSIRMDTPTDPAGKFAEALYNLVTEVESKDSQIIKTEAYKKYKEYYEKGHFPGLGVAKKLSMQHHIETLAKFLSE